MYVVYMINTIIILMIINEVKVYQRLNGQSTFVVENIWKLLAWKCTTRLLYRD